MIDLPQCPYCEGSESVYRNVRVSGRTKEYFDMLGYAGDMPNTDEIVYSHPKTVRCSKCDKQRRDLKIVDGQYLVTRQEYLEINKGY